MVCKKPTYFFFPFTVKCQIYKWLRLTSITLGSKAYSTESCSRKHNEGLIKIK